MLMSCINLSLVYICDIYVSISLSVSWLEENVSVYRGEISI